jgi:hypothetical protein
MSLPPTPPPDPRFVLYCRVCGRAERCPPGDVSRYVVVGWPACCGEVMTLDVASDPPPGPPPGSGG